MSPESGLSASLLINRPSFTHLRLLLEIEDSFKRAFYRVKKIEDNWSVRVVFVDPHGLHDEEVADNDRFAAIEKLRGLGENERFKTKKVILDGYVLAPSGTALDKIPGAKDKSWDDLEREYPLLRQGDSYVGRLFSALP